MRKFGMITAILLMVTAFVFADDDRVTTNINELPAESRRFIEQWFGDTAVSYIKIDRNLLGLKGYEVMLKNGVEIEFNASGDWKEIDAKKQLLPAGVIPSYVSAYINEHYTGVGVVSMDRDDGMLEVKLINGLELTFDPNGNMVHLDD